MKKGAWAEINGNHVVRLVTSCDIHIFPRGLIFFFASEIVFTLFLISYPTFVFLVILLNSLFSPFFSGFSDCHSFPLILDSLAAHMPPHISTFSLSQKASKT